jgi:hypothetical protein
MAIAERIWANRLSTPETFMIYLHFWRLHIISRQRCTSAGKAVEFSRFSQHRT